MGQKLVVGPISKGLSNYFTPFNIDNDSFPTLINAFQWRGRVKRKRGTDLLCRLRRFINSSASYGGYSGTLDGTGSANILTDFHLETNASIKTGVTILDTTSGTSYTDPALNGVLVPSVIGPNGSINYASGIFSLGVANAGHGYQITIIYYPSLPVMGLEDLILNPSVNPGTLAFDTTYSYQIDTNFPNLSHNVSFYANPAVPAGGIFPNYVPKSTWTPVIWNGLDYQQFWTTNYQGSLWACNGVQVPFSISNVGMQYKAITTVTINQASGPAQATLNIPTHGLVVGDFLFINEVVTTLGINFQTGYVIQVIDGNNVKVEFPAATLTHNGTGGIAQYLTNTAIAGIDCIRYYTGDPTNGSPTNPMFVQGNGWVNFCPPLSIKPFVINDSPPAIYYLVGAKMIVPFKDRLLFLGPVIQSSSGGSQIYLQDTVIYSQDGTPYYTVSYTNSPSATVDTPTNPPATPPGYLFMLLPNNYTATPYSFFEDQTGFGGFIAAGLFDTITTVSPNEDVLIIGFKKTYQTRLIYSGNDVTPFLFYIINSELGSASTFSQINMDKGVLTKGDRGFILTTQVGAERIDLQIPDQIFQINLLNNGNERVCAQRDFISEWIYFTYPSDEVSYNYPTQTLLYNYRDETFAILNESYTTYGQFTSSSGITWATVGESLQFPQWNSWNTPWNSGQSTVEQPIVIAGTTQGFVMARNNGVDDTTNEGSSIAIQSISGNVVTSPNHCLNSTDYIVISGAIGPQAAQLNGLVFSVGVTKDNTFTLNPSVSFSPGDYLGGGLIVRMYNPFIQTKQFPIHWDKGMKTRIGAQQYLLTTTSNSQITLQIYLSQDASTPYNSGTIVPAPDAINNSLIYNSVLFTSPELYTQICTNLPLGKVGDGTSLTYTFNLQSLFEFNTTLVPGTVNVTIGNSATFLDNGLGGFTATGTGTSVGSSVNYATSVVTIVFTIAPLQIPSKISFNYYVNNIQSPTASNQAQIWHRMNTSLLGDTVQLGFTMSDTQMRDPTLANQFAEIELHGMIIDVSPSGMLS